MKAFFFLIFILIVTNVLSQVTNYSGKIMLEGGSITDNIIPFWMRSNQFGSLPLEKASIGFLAGIKKDYQENPQHLLDWGASLDGRVDAGATTKATLLEGYGKVRLWIFQLQAGRSRDVMGLSDTTLSSGAFAISGNALGIPKIEGSIPRFYVLPFLGRMFAFKGNFAHGWVGKVPTDSPYPEKNLMTYLHQKSFYGRFGKESWRWRAYGGFNHQVFWGSERQYYGPRYSEDFGETFWYVLSGKVFGKKDGLPQSKLGNQIGSLDLGFGYDLKNTRLFIYHQFFYDVGALAYLANIRDGLTGISFTNRLNDQSGWYWKKMLFELFYSKNQAGELWSKATPSGDEDYYNNPQYKEGWSYQGLGLGNPFICNTQYTREGLPHDPGDYFFNNRVVAFHTGFIGGFSSFQFKSKLSYSFNYGTFGTSEVGHTLGKQRRLPKFGIFPETRQFSGYLEAGKRFGKLEVGCVTAFDIGKLYDNSFGLIVKVGRRF